MMMMQTRMGKITTASSRGAGVTLKRLVELKENKKSIGILIVNSMAMSRLV